MKSLVIAFGGTKAARIADILAYYSKKLEARVFVEVFDSRGHPIPDAKISVKRLEDSPENQGLVLTKTPGLIPYRIDVTKEGYQPVSENADVKPEQISIARVILAKEPLFPLITTVYLTLLAPFIWAILRYMGMLVNLPPADYMSLATLLSFVLLAGAFFGIKTFGRTLFQLTQNQYFSTIIGVLIGEFIALVACNGILGFLSGFLSIIGNIFGTTLPGDGDIAFIAICVAGLAIIGCIIDWHFLPGLKRNWLRSSMFVATGAMYGGMLHYLNTGGIINALMGGSGNLDIRAIFPFLVLGFSLIWCYAVLHLLGKHTDTIIPEKRHFAEATYTLIGVGIISFILPVIFGKTTIALTFPVASLLGAFSGIVLYFLIFGALSVTPGIQSLTDGECLRKRYRLQTTSFVVDTVRSRLESMKFIDKECALFMNEPSRDEAGFFNTDLRDQIRKKINGIYRKNLQDCSRLFSSFTVIIDLRNNNLCAIYPQVLEFLREEYSVPIYAVVISTEQKLNRNWMRKVADKADSVFPVDYQLFEDMLYLDRFFYQHGSELVKENIYEEGCVVELINRIAPLLEIGERQSPSGLDISHVNRLLSRDRVPMVPCNDIPDIVPPAKHNISTFGYFLLNSSKCRNLNLELGMGEYIDFAMKHTLWGMKRSSKSTRAIIIVRGRRELAKVGLVRDRIKGIYNGLILILGDLLTESSDTLEIIILISHIMEDIPEDPSAGSNCAESLPDAPTEPRLFRKYWNSLVKKESLPSGNLDERSGTGNNEYVNMVKKHYNRSPLIRHRAVSLAREYPGIANWEQAKAICEWVRDSIGYVSDPLGSEYIQTPEETLNNGGGDCDDMAVLLSALLMNVRFPCALVFLQKHVYVAVYLPQAPENMRTFDSGLPWPDGSSSHDWIGFDPTCKNCRFGDLPETDRQFESIEIIG